MMALSPDSEEAHGKPEMEVKEAAQTAREYLANLFAEEEITNVGLEEVVFDDVSNEWRITIGFSRPWNRQNALRRLSEARSYKVVCINDESGNVTSLKDRLLAASN